MTLRFHWFLPTNGDGRERGAAEQQSGWCEARLLDDQRACPFREQHVWRNQGGAE